MFNDWTYPLSMFGLTFLGLALIWSVQLVYGARRHTSDDFFKRTLLICGWLLLLSGMLGLLTSLTGGISINFWFIVLVVLFMCLGKYQDSERRALLWALAVAAEKGIPLHQAVRAFADEHTMSLGVRTSQLADLLEQGVPLPEAMYESRNTLTLDTLLAARVGSYTGQLGPALRQVIRQSDLIEGSLRAAQEKLLYVAILTLLAVGLVSFLMIKIVPVFSMTLVAFEMAVPTATVLLTTIATWFSTFWPLMFPFYLMVLAGTLIGLLYYVGWLRLDLPLLSRVFLRLDAAIVLRSLSLGVRQQRSLPETLQVLAGQYPRAGVRSRLERALNQMQGGTHWCDSLLGVRLIRPAEAAVLNAAERVGNLAWALDEMADSVLRRLALRLRVAIGWVFPLLILAMGFFVGLCALGLFQPLASLISNLS